MSQKIDQSTGRTRKFWKWYFISAGVFALFLLMLNFGCSLKPMNSEGDVASSDSVKADTLDDVIVDNPEDSKEVTSAENNSNESESKSEDDFFKDITKVDDEKSLAEKN